MGLALIVLVITGSTQGIKANAETASNSTITTTTTVTSTTNNTIADTAVNITTGAAVIATIDNGWELVTTGSQDRNWYYYEHGKKVKGEREIAGDQYFFDHDGRMVANGWVVDGVPTNDLDPQYTNTTYFYDAEGRKVIGWYKVDNAVDYPYGNWKFFDENGINIKGWLASSGYWYYLDQNNGRDRIGWITVYNDKYYLDQNGRMCTGWIWYNSRWYFLKPNGAMQTGWIKYNNAWYFLADDGAMVSNCYIGRYHVGNTGVWDN